MSLSNKRRFEILSRDKFRCRYCGRAASDGVVLNVDHIHPKAHGGTDDEGNLVTACWECNNGKRDRILRPIPKAAKRRIYPVVAPVVEEPPEFAIGSACLTPLKIAAIGCHLGISSYAQAHRYIAGLPTEALMPPMRKGDAAWYRVVKGDPSTTGTILAAILQKAIGDAA